MMPSSALGAADHLLAAVTDDGCEGSVDLAEETIGQARESKPYRAGIEQPGEALLGGTQGAVGSLALRDIVREGSDAQNLAGAIADGEGGNLAVEDAAVFGYALRLGAFDGIALGDLGHIRLHLCAAAGRGGAW